MARAPRRRRPLDAWKKEVIEARRRRPIRVTPEECGCLDCRPLGPLPPEVSGIFVRPATEFYLLHGHITE